MAPKDPKQEMLKTVPLLSRLAGSEIAKVARLMDTVDVGAGQVLMRQGQAGREMFIIEHGHFQVERDGQTIAQSGPGDVLGEIALISEGPRTATVTATEASRLFVVGHREFHALLETSPKIRDHVYAQLAERIRTLDPGAIC